MVHANDEEYMRESWRMFRIMSEFVMGFDVLSQLRPAVTIFGSARAEEGGPMYQLAREVGELLGRDYWNGLSSWIDDCLVGDHFIASEDRRLYEMVDTAAEVLDIVVSASGERDGLVDNVRLA